VDKSPSYALDAAALGKAEDDFEGALYVHLIRHPQPMIESFVRHHMEQILFLEEHSFDSRQLAELVWTASHQNILAFLTQVPDERWHRLRYEDLVRDPAGQMEALCGRLGLRFDPALLKPYEGLEHKMVDGVYPESAPMGDPGFLARDRIDPTAADGRNGSGELPQLGEPTLDIAARLGYGNGPPSTDRRPGRDALAAQRALRRGWRDRAP
jgi:hypothetical protein